VVGFVAKKSCNRLTATAFSGHWLEIAAGYQGQAEMPVHEFLEKC
jgi:hypothetical protein